MDTTASEHPIIRQAEFKCYISCFTILTHLSLDTLMHVIMYGTHEGDKMEQILRNNLPKQIQTGSHSPLVNQYCSNKA